MPRHDDWAPSAGVRIGDRVRIESIRSGGAHGVPGTPATGVIVAFHHHPPRADVRPDPPDGSPPRCVDLADLTVLDDESGI
ncbi:hypothetical protein [Gordonia insulae]|uniref:Uncharacterized protein n=1 Tax=Gordonia insulae TaxID=2420509 RepID=A0A3G8JTR1_9ACTN|nr:hypothetical protein [Gordonia insulae]AZG48105.1 hypothetical protein D7316_04718 [Gordonia insulae]